MIASGLRLCDPSARQLLHEEFTLGHTRSVKTVHIGVEVPTGENHQLLRFAGPFIRVDGEVGPRWAGVRWSSRATTMSSDVGLIRPIQVPGSYSPSISTVRRVTSLRHDGARVLPVSVNHVQESGVGSANGASGSSSTHAARRPQR